MKPVNKYLSYQTETKCGQTDVRTTDGQMDGRMDICWVLPLFKVPNNHPKSTQQSVTE